MHMHVQDFFWALHLIALPVFCIKIKNIETRTAQLFLGKDGELLDSSGIPNCGPGNKIILKSYTYNRMKCTSASCESVHEEQLSPSTSLQLHQNCSFRPTCEALKFPVLKRLRAPPSELHAVTIKYQCIDDQSSVLNMCEKHKMNFSDTLHLTFKYYTQNLKNCECWVNQGAFSLTIMDLRLKSRNKDACSAAKFLINGHHFTCDPESGSYGAVFGELIQDDMPLGAFISLVPNSDTTLPEMVWIQLIPEAYSQIDCHGDRIASDESQDMPTITTTKVTGMSDTTEYWHPSKTTTADENILQPPTTDTNNTGLWIAVCILSLLLIVIPGLLFRENLQLKRIVKEFRQQQNTVHPVDQTTRDGEPILDRALAVVVQTQTDFQDVENISTMDNVSLVEGSQQIIYSSSNKTKHPLHFRSLPDFKSSFELPRPAHQQSLSGLNQVGETERKQVSMSNRIQQSTECFPQGIQRSEIRKDPITTVNTPSASLLTISPLTTSPDTSSLTHFYDVGKDTFGKITAANENTDEKLLKLAEGIITADSEPEMTEESPLVNDINSEISVPGGKNRK